MFAFRLGIAVSSPMSVLDRVGWYERHSNNCLYKRQKIKTYASSDQYSTTSVTILFTAWLLSDQQYYAWD